MAPSVARFTIGVMGSGHDEHDALASEVGRLLAQLGVNLLTGGGRGVMTSVSRAFVGAERTSGISIGILPCTIEDRTRRKEGYPNPFIELAIDTHLPLSGLEGTGDLSRNHINILSSAAVVALPGGPGTTSEVELAVRYRKPVIAFSADPKLASGFPDGVPRAASIKEVEAFLLQHLK